MAALLSSRRSQNDLSYSHKPKLASSQSYSYNNSSRPSSSSRYQPLPLSLPPPTPDLIIPNLYLTDLLTARTVLLPTFKQPTITPIKYMLSALGDSLSQPKPRPTSNTTTPTVTQKLIIVDDTLDADLLVHLDSACDWISECLAHNNGAVLVHCQLGQSRSVGIVTAYLMRTLGLGVEEAIENVRKARKNGKVKLNPEFKRQLELWEGLGYCIWEIDTAVDADSEIKEEVRMRQKEAYVKWKEERRKRFEVM